MKRFRYVVLVVLLVLMTMGTRLSTSLSAAPPQGKEIDPACLSFCQQQNLQCFLAATRESDQHHCTAEYRHCIAQCGKH